MRDFILAATYWAEMFQRRFYIARMTIEYFDSFPEIIRPVWSKLVEVDTIKYLDSSGVLQVLDDTEYRVDTGVQPGSIEPAYGLEWPVAYPVTNSVIVTYTAGYGEAADVPADIKAAIKMIVQYYHGRCSEFSLIGQAKRILWKRKLVSV